MQLNTGSKEFFRDNYGDTPVTIIDNPGLVDKEKYNEFKKTTFAGYFKEIEADRRSNTCAFCVC